MADTVAVVRDGRVVQAAPPDELYLAPADLGVAMFVGEAVVLPGCAAEGGVECALGRLPLRGDGRPGGRGTVVIRPEQVLLGPAGSGVPAAVTGTVFYGHDALVQLALLDGVEGRDESDGGLRVIARTQGRPAVAERTPVGLRVEGAVSFFPDPGFPDSG